MRLKGQLKDWIDLIVECTAAGGEFRLYPGGESMLPLIHEDRDSVGLVAPSFPLRRGDLALYRRPDGTFVLHRVVAVEESGGYTFCGDNQIVLEPGVLREQIYATVKTVWRGDRIRRGFFYRLYGKLIVFRWVRHTRLYYRAGLRRICRLFSGN